MPDDSLLLSVHEVRDSIEHVDERIDRISLDRNVYSVSDWYVATGVYFDPEGGTSSGSGSDAVRHENMRTFVPALGILVFGSTSIDLFNYEVCLYNLLTAHVDAREQLATESPPGKTPIGSAKPLFIDWNTGKKRREQIGQVRKEVEADGKYRLTCFEQRTVVLAFDTQSVPQLGTLPE